LIDGKGISLAWFKVLTLVIFKNKTYMMLVFFFILGIYQNIIEVNDNKII
jgi:hypothetical protein